MSEEVSGQNSGGRPRKWASESQRKAASRQKDRENAEQAARDEEFIAAELEITRAHYLNAPPGTLAAGGLAERLDRSEEYLRKWVDGELGPRSR